MMLVATFVRDLLFSSKIREVAAQLGVKVQGALDPAALARAVDAGAKLVIVVLRLERALEALDAVAASGVPCVGFVDHEKTDVMDAARARGCGRVLAKGQFSKELPQILAEL